MDEWMKTDENGRMDEKWMNGSKMDEWIKNG